ncbi:MAG: heterodisulfide reductase-related iron-sulfur binding cluster, partial [Actinomycetota bacterium]|nr:heterodisulfide reductase-related iron-sulfur binding cluster [Actinomycetota bacterium]
VYSPPARSLLMLGYPTIYEAGDHVPQILEHSPVGLEGIDDELIRNMQLRGMHPSDIPMLPEGKGWLLVEFGGETTEEAHGKAQKVMEELKKAEAPPSMELFESADATERIWGIREDGLGATAYVPQEGDHWPGWEDSAVAPGRVGDYLRDLRDLYDKYGYHASLYGHFGDGCIHCRVDFDLKTAEGIKKWHSFMEEAADLVISYGGSLSGEHGDGQQRAELLPKMYGEELMQAFREFKSIWDSEWKMNPGKVIDANPMTEDLRLGKEYNPREPETYFSYPQDHGSFAHATLRCVGAGKCRDVESGTMCPSYMVTLEEEHTTRGRARILHEMLRGKVIEDGFRSRKVFDALDLCLSCKGCKGDCPVDVDMATYKAEFLSKYYKRRLRPTYAYAMGLIMFHARLAQHAPRVANLVTHAPVIRTLLKRASGLTTEREMPPFAHQTFKAWFKERGPMNLSGPPVVLFPDTFNNYLHPEPIKAAVEVLEDAGYRVIIPQQPLCCGRPLYDYGMLDTAKGFLERLVKDLSPYVREGIKLVGVEPSCVAVFRDELTNMLPHDEDAKRLSQNTLTLSEFLVKEAGDYEPPKLERKALVHGHCHHKAIMGMSDEEKLLSNLGLDFEILDSGCCGLAGSFGFENDHYDISMKVGEHRLLPTVRDAAKDTLIVSDGFSCKTQIEHATDRRALHTAQVIRMAMDHGRSGPAGDYPERDYPDVALDSGHKSAVKAAAAAASVTAVGSALAWRWKRRSG